MVRPAGGNGGRWAAGENDSGNGTRQPAAHLPFFSPHAAHHSAAAGGGISNKSSIQTHDRASLQFSILNSQFSIRYASTFTTTFTVLCALVDWNAFNISRKRSL